MELREEQPSDVAAIRAVHDAAFKGSKVEGEIVDRLRERGKLLISVVCEEDGKVVGHAAYSPITYKNREIGIGLGPIGVLPERQNLGIGSKLTLEGNALAFSKNYENIFVLGDPAYYCRFEFDLASRLNLYSKFDPEGRHFMIFSRNPEPYPQKIFVDYDKAFDAAG